MADRSDSGTLTLVILHFVVTGNIRDCRHTDSTRESFRVVVTMDSLSQTGRATQGGGEAQQTYRNRETLICKELICQELVRSIVVQLHDLYQHKNLT